MALKWRQSIPLRLSLLSSSLRFWLSRWLWLLWLWLQSPWRYCDYRPDALLRQRIGWALVQIMACRLIGAKPLSKPMLAYCQLDPKEQTSVKFQSKFNHFHSRKCVWKCRLRNGGHFVRGDELSLRRGSEHSSPMRLGNWKSFYDPHDFPVYLRIWAEVFIILRPG